MSILFGGETSQTNHEPFFVGPPTSLHALRIGDIKREGKGPTSYRPQNYIGGLLQNGLGGRFWTVQEKLFDLI